MSTQSTPSTQSTVSTKAQTPVGQGSRRAVPVSNSAIRNPQSAIIAPLDPLSPNRPTAAPEPAAATEVLVQPSTLPVPSGGTAPAIIPEGWAGVAYWSRLVGRLEHARLAAQVMCGFSLLELHKQYRVRAGRPAKGKLPKSLVISSERDGSLGGTDVNPNASWPDLVRQHAGISDETARNYMAMAEACRPRLKKLQSGPRLRELLLLPPSSWSDDDMTLVSAAVRKLSDGRTQLDFMSELGLIKTGPNPTGGARPQGQPKSQLEQLEQTVIQVREEWLHAERHLLLVVGARFCLLNDTQVEAQIACLELCLKARRQWLNTPTTERNTGPIESLFA